MNLNSALDSENIKQKFFTILGDEFRRGVTIARLEELSRERGVWEGVEDDLMREGIAQRIKSWVRGAKENGRRIYHSLPSLDSEGKEVPIFKQVALFSLDDYKTVLRQYEKRINDNLAAYLDLVEQARERYAYQHPLPYEVRQLINGALAQTVTD